MAARISLLGRGCGALGAERGNKTLDTGCFTLFVRYLRQLEIEPAERDTCHASWLMLSRIKMVAAGGVPTGDSCWARELLLER